MAVHWGWRGLTESEREDEWQCYTDDPEGYETPTACARAYLPEAGAGHYMRGIWPPRDIPSHVWDTLQLYRYCNQWQALPAPGGVLSQCSWTMAAFSLIGSTGAAVSDARREWAAKQK